MPMSAGRILAAMIVTFFIALVALHLLTSCASTNQQRANTALKVSFDVIGVSIDKASKFSYETCVAKQDAELNKVRAGTQTTAQAETALNQIRQRCYELKETFSLMRTLYNQALDFLKSDALEKAQEKLKEVQQLWFEASEQGTAP